MSGAPDERFELARSDFQDAVNVFYGEFVCLSDAVPPSLRAKVYPLMSAYHRFLNEADDYIAGLAPHQVLEDVHHVLLRPEQIPNPSYFV